MWDERVCTARAAEKYLGVEQMLDLLLHQPRLVGAGLLVVAEEARKPFAAVAVALPCRLELVGLKQ